MFSSFPRPLVFLGILGLARQAICLVMARQDEASHWFAIAAACCHAAVILLFLDGL